MLQEKLAEAHGLAMAASDVVEKVDARTADDELRAELAQMRLDAEDTRRRCLGAYDEAVARDQLAHANSTHAKAADLAAAWFKAGTDPLRAWSFLAMAEAGEVAVWLALLTLATGEAADLAAWALPIQQQHLETALAGVARIAAQHDPAEARWG